MHLPVGHFFRCLPNDTDDADDEYDVKEQVEQSLSTNVKKWLQFLPVQEINISADQKC